MTSHEMHKLLAKQANEVEILAEQMAVSFTDYRIGHFIQESKKAGKDWIDCHTMRMPFRLLMMLDIYAYIFEYISGDQLKEKYSEYQKLYKKFCEGGEYDFISKNDGDRAPWRHMSLRPARLLPQF